MMREVLIISYPGAAGEGGRELRRGFCAPGLPLATHNIHRAAEFVGIMMLIATGRKLIACGTRAETLGVKLIEMAGREGAI